MKNDIVEQMAKIDAAIEKHKPLAAWGNVESKERLKYLRAKKRELKMLMKS